MISVNFEGDDMSDSKMWRGQVTCGICGSKQTSEVEIPSWATEPIVPIVCDFCGHAACQYELPTSPDTLDAPDDWEDDYGL